MSKEMDLLKHAVASGQSYNEVLQLDLQEATTPNEREQGLINTPANTAMTFPNSTGSFTTEGMNVNLNISKFDNQGNIVQSYRSAPPGIDNLPMGNKIGTVIETPSQYQTGGLVNKYQEGGLKAADIEHLKREVKRGSNHIVYAVGSSGYEFTWAKTGTSTVPDYKTLEAFKKGYPDVTHIGDGIWASNTQGVYYQEPKDKTTGGFKSEMQQEHIREFEHLSKQYKQKVYDWESSMGRDWSEDEETNRNWKTELSTMRDRLWELSTLVQAKKQSNPGDSNAPIDIQGGGTFDYEDDYWQETQTPLFSTKRPKHKPISKIPIKKAELLPTTTEEPVLEKATPIEYESLEDKVKDVSFSYSNYGGADDADVIDKHGRSFTLTLKDGSKMRLAPQTYRNYFGTKGLVGKYKGKELKVFKRDGGFVNKYQGPVQTSEVTESDKKPYTFTITPPAIDVVEKRVTDLDDAIKKVTSFEDKKDQRSIEQLLKMTAFMENRYGKDKNAYNRDYTNSMMSIDPIMLNHLFDKPVDEKGTAQKYTKSQKKWFKRLKELGLPSDKIEFKKLLREDNPLAAIAATRMTYAKSPKSLPKFGDTSEMFNIYYKDYNRTNKYQDKKTKQKRFESGWENLFPFKIPMKYNLNNFK